MAERKAEVQSAMATLPKICRACEAAYKGWSHSEIAKENGHLRHGEITFTLVIHATKRSARRKV